MILIDSREQFKEQIKTKLQSLHINAHVLKLENYADYVLTSDNKEVSNTVAVQRKTIGEVLSQFKDIQMRLPELEAYGIPWLLVEENGLFINSSGMIMSKRGKLLYETGIKAQAYYNFLHSVQRAGTTVKITSNWEQSVWWLYSLHQYIQKEHYPKLNRKYTQKEEIVGTVQTIPNVGSEKAQQIYSVYELLHKPFGTADLSIHNLRAFGRLLTRVKLVLNEYSKSELTKQLKSIIVKDEALLNAFISVLIEEGYLQKEQKGKYVYCSLPHKKHKEQNTIVEDDDKWLEEADVLTEEME